MRIKLIQGCGWPCGLGAALMLAVCSCSKSTSDDVPTASTPKAAASQLEQVFTSATVEVRNDSKVAAEALRSADYEKALESLQALKARQNLTFDQGMAVYNSMVSLEGKLIAAIEAGDPNAKRAYERLKASRRN